MIYSYYQFEQNRDSKEAYYSRCRVESVSPEEEIDELKEEVEQVRSLRQSLGINFISDNKSSEDESPRPVS
jgi:hypothetical protein